MTQTANNLQMLHTMIRVQDADRSLAFYCDGLGMTLRRRADYEDGRFSLIYLGYGDGTDVELELTHNWDQEDDYSHGSGYGHIAVGAKDIYALCSELEAKGVSVIRKPGPMGDSGIDIAFIEDPDGYKVELIQYPFPPPA